MPIIDPDRRKEYEKKYYEKNKKRAIRLQRKYQELNKEKIKEYHKQYYENKKQNATRL